ncbi:hypothetical protein IWQ62_002030 [Dispira parvispora]|uniref:RGS domain-containing protein n=1 Tax=Dispira parvispora TaxID=1520584 RepID=A0A9W8AWM4_9FUNG|nr:hypothetical protein IWQ62_002030 [Dispira parvispora]
MTNANLLLLMVATGLYALLVLTTAALFVYRFYHSLGPSMLFTTVGVLAAFISNFVVLVQSISPIYSQSCVIRLWATYLGLHVWYTCILARVWCTHFHSSRSVHSHTSNPTIEDGASPTLIDSHPPPSSFTTHRCWSPPSFRTWLPTWRWTNGCQLTVGIIGSTLGWVVFLSLVTSHHIPLTPSSEDLQCPMVVSEYFPLMGWLAVLVFVVTPIITYLVWPLSHCRGEVQRDLSVATACTVIFLIVYVIQCTGAWKATDHIYFWTTYGWLFSVVFVSYCVSVALPLIYPWVEAKLSPSPSITDLTSWETFYAVLDHPELLAQWQAGDIPHILRFLLAFVEKYSFLKGAVWSVLAESGESSPWSTLGGFEKFNPITFNQIVNSSAWARFASTQCSIGLTVHHALLGTPGLSHFPFSLQTLYKEFYQQAIVSAPPSSLDVLGDTVSLLTQRIRAEKYSPEMFDASYYKVIDVLYRCYFPGFIETYPSMIRRRLTSKS